MKKMVDKALQVDALAYVKHWVNAIALHAPGAPMVFVGTCKDQVNSRPDHHQPISNLIESTFLSHLKRAVFNQRDNLLFFPIDNTASDKDATMTELRQAVDEAVREQEYVGLEVPVSWLACYDYLQHEFSGKGNPPPKRLSLEQFVTVASRFGIKVDIASDQMLQVLHEFGLLLRFSDPQLREVVILDPQWLLDTFSAIIRDFDLHIRPTDAAALEHPEEWIMLRDRALLHPNLIPLLWSEHSEEERRACLQLMCKHHLAVELRRKTWSKSSGESAQIIYQIPSILPFNLSGHRTADLSDTISSRFQSALPHYSASAKLPSDDTDQTAVFYFAFHLNMACYDPSTTVTALEQSALLPEGLFARLLCYLVQQQQLVGFTAQRLSRTAAKIVFGNATASLNIVPHIGSIRVATSPKLALRIAVRVEEILKSIIESLFPALKCDTLLPFDDNHLVYLDRIQRAAELGQQLKIGDVFLNPTSTYAAFMRHRGLLDSYHCMISYRQLANKKFVLRLHDILENIILTDEQPMQVFLDEFGLVEGCQFVDDFCLALSCSLVALPVVSLQAIKGMVAALEAGKPDYVLLEWSLMLVLNDSEQLKRIFPIVVGDSWCNNSQDQITLKTFEEFMAVIQGLALDAVNDPTHWLLEEFVTRKLKLPGPIRRRTAREVVLNLLNKFYGLHCFQESVAEQEQNSDTLQEYAQKIQRVVIESMDAVRTASGPSPSTPGDVITASKVCQICVRVRVRVFVFIHYRFDVHSRCDAKRNEKIIVQFVAFTNNIFFRSFWFHCPCRRPPTYSPFWPS